jgi:hypothetical protein
MEGEDYHDEMEIFDEQYLEEREEEEEDDNLPEYPEGEESEGDLGERSEIYHFFGGGANSQFISTLIEEEVSRVFDSDNRVGWYSDKDIKTLLTDSTGQDLTSAFSSHETHSSIMNYFRSLLKKKKSWFDYVKSMSPDRYRDVDVMRVMNQCIELSMTLPLSDKHSIYTLILTSNNIRTGNYSYDSCGNGVDEAVRALRL